MGMRPRPEHVRSRAAGAWSARSARSLALLLSLATAAAAASGCGRGDDGGAYFGATARAGKDPTTFYLNAGAEPEYLDPGKSGDTASASMILQLFEGLTSYAPVDLRPTQGVAERWDRSDDNRIFRFHLRDGARWSDGKPVTAHDFEYAWKRVLRPATASKAAQNLHVLKNGELFNLGKLKAAAADTVVRAEPRPDAPAVATLARGSFVVILAREGGAGGAGARWAKVALHGDLPTYDPGAAPDVTPGALGFVPEAALVEDDRAVGVRAASERVLEVELSRPTPYFTDLTGLPNFMPVRRDVVEPFEARGEADLWFRPENIVGNGPYALDEWKFRYEITMKRNPMYWDRDRLRIHRVVWMSVEQPHAVMNLYKGGELDYSGENTSLPSEYLGLLSSRQDFRCFDYLSTYWYELNVRKPPVDDARVRRALNLAIDKRQIVEKITRGGQQPATHYVPDFTGSGYAEQGREDRERGADPFAAPGLQFDPARGRALLAEAGYQVVEEGGAHRAIDFPPLEILYNTNEGHRQIAVAVQDMWKRHLGIAVTLRNEEWGVMLKSQRDGHFQVVRAGWAAEYNHPHTWLATLLSGSTQNRTGWSDPEFDELVRRAAATADPKESIRLYREAEARALEGMPKLPVYFLTKSSLVKPWVKGFTGNARNIQLMKWLWIDPTWQGSADDGAVAAPPLELPAPGRILPAAEGRP